MRLHSSSVRPAELTRKPRSQSVREKSAISGRNSCSALSLPKRKRMSRSEYGNSSLRPYPPRASRHSPAGGVLCTRSTSPKIWRILLSASSHSARRVSRAPAPAANCSRMRRRSSSACGPSTDKGVREPCMFRSGWRSGRRPGRAAVVTSIKARFRRARRCGSGWLLQPAIGISYRPQSFLSWPS